MGILDFLKGKKKGVAVVAIADEPVGGIILTYGALLAIANDTPGYWMEGNKLMMEVEINDDNLET